MVDAAGEAAWQGSCDMAERGSLNALYLKGRGERLAASSLMLSTYIESMKGIRKSGSPLPKRLALLALWGIRAEIEASRLRARWFRLAPHEMNVLVTWLIVTGKIVPDRANQAYGYGYAALDFTRAEFERGRALPHQVALAEVAVARAIMLKPRKTGSPELIRARALMSSALRRARAIRDERSRPQALLQLVRIFIAASEFYSVSGKRLKGQTYLNIALELAEGEAGALSEAEDIRRALRG